MDINNLKFVHAGAKSGEVATINFFDDVDYWSVSDFVNEFNWLANWVKPSLIKVLINSAGGSVIDGMSAFAAIMNSSIKTEVIVEGIAASMASVLLAAGDVSKMRDYAIIMIHNPYFHYGEDEEEDLALKAFRDQLKSIYKSRWNLTEEKITEIMNGAEGEDGTFLNADDAVELGIITEENVIKTEPQTKAKIQAAIKKVGNSKDYTKVYAELRTGLPNNSKPKSNNKAIIKNKGDNDSLTKIKNNMEHDYTSIAATLSMSKDSKEADVLARVAELNKAEAKVADLEKAKNDLFVKSEGLKSSLDNVKADLAARDAELIKVKSELSSFKEKEEEKAKSEKEAFIQAAVTDGKITKEAKESWEALAETNFEAVKAAIDNMEARQKLSDVVVTDNVEAKVLETEEEKRIAAKVAEVVGDKFEFKTLN